MKKYSLLFLAIFLIFLSFVSLVVGRYPVTIGDLYAIFIAKISGAEFTYQQDEIFFLLTEVRIPRILSAILVGAALSVSGAIYQAMFLNPLVSPKFLGVLDGASFGAAVGIVVFKSWFAIQFLSFGFALLAVAFSIMLAGLFKRGGMMVLILGGMVSSSLFTSLTSLMKYIADPQDQLPEIVFWILGTFARSNAETIAHMGPIMFAGTIILALSGKAANALSMGDDEAASLGVDVKKMRVFMVGVATLVCASTVVIAGVISWVGLVVPHIIRFLIGPDNRFLLPCAAVGGGAFMLLTDLMVRSVFTAEIPISIATSIIGIPLFIFSLYHNRGAWR